MSQSFIDKLRSPIRIGNRECSNRLLLAPMAGLGHMALRELIVSYGNPGLLYTEMCGAKAVPHENRHHSPVFRWRDEELPYLVCQLFGSDPQEMAIAAKRIESEGFFGIDINLGCSVAAICKRNCGAALLKTPDLAIKIVRSVRSAVSIPLSVKYRTGWQDDPVLAVSLARRFEEEGVDALLFHPRVAPDRRSRPPRWEYIQHVKDAVAIPVFGNGNVFDINDVNRMMEISNCDGIAIGRIAVAKPWIFAEWLGADAFDSTIYQDCSLKMLSLLECYYDPQRALRLFKKFAIYFASNFRFGHAVYSKLSSAGSINEMKDRIDQLFASLPELVARPNLNLFNA